MTDYSALATNLPLINVSETYDQSWFELYVLYHILDDLQPGLGTVYVDRYNGIVPSTDTLDLFMQGAISNPTDAAIIPELNQAAQAAANSLQAAGGNYGPAIVSGLKTYIDTLHFWDPVKDLLKSLVSGIGDKLSALSTTQFTQDVQVADANTLQPNTIIDTSGYLSFSSAISFDIASDDQLIVDGSGGVIDGGGQHLSVESGQLVLADADLENVSQFQDNGYVLIDPSELDVNSLSGTGDITIGADSVLDVEDAGGFTGGVAFDGADATMVLENADDFAGSISGFTPGDVLLLGLDGYPDAATIDGGNLVLTSDGSTVFSLPFSGSNNENENFIIQNYEDEVSITEIGAPTASGTGSQAIHPAYYNSTTQSYISYELQFALSNTEVNFAPIRLGEVRDQAVGITLSLTGASGVGSTQSYFLAQALNTNVSGIFLDANNGFQDIGPSISAATFTMYTGGASDGRESVNTGIVISYESLQNGPGGEYLSFSSTTLTVVGETEVYAAARPEFIINGVASNSYFFGGIFGGVHVGQSASVDVTIVNTAYGTLQDNLITNPNTVGDFTAENGLDLAPGQSGVVTVSVYGYMAGEFQAASNDLFGATSHDAVLPDIQLNGYYGNLNAEIVNYAAPVLYDAIPGTTPTPTNLNGLTPITGPYGGTLTQNGSNWTLDFGTLSQSAAPSYFSNIVIENVAPTLIFSDGLTGSITAMGSGFIYDIGPSSYQVAEGDGLSYIELGDFVPDFLTTGTEQMSVVFAAESTDEWSTTALSPITLTVDADIVAICFLSGTKILTTKGDRPIEELLIGDELVTRFGGVQQIKWIGEQHFDRRFLKPDMLPVCISAGALAYGMPKRDLFVSPGHSMLLGKTLVLARDLVNGVTITQHWAPDHVRYYNIELENHDCIRAEGAWAETYADCPRLRAKFHNAGSFDALYPGVIAPRDLQLCAPRPQAGPMLDAALQSVIAIAAAETTPGPLHGYLEDITPYGEIRGWAYDIANPTLPVVLLVLLGETIFGPYLAREHRGDLVAAGFGRGQCGFCLKLPCLIDRSQFNYLQLRRAIDNAILPRSCSLQSPLWKTAA